jgi:hypothetical protein
MVTSFGGNRFGKVGRSLGERGCENLGERLPRCAIISQQLAISARVLRRFPSLCRVSMLRKREKERRRWSRLPVAIPVFLRGSDEQGKEILEFSTILNISAGGVLFASRKQVRPHSRVFLEVPVGFPAVEEAAHAQRKFQARVLRIVRRDGWYWCAAQFKAPLKVGSF